MNPFPAASPAASRAAPDAALGPQGAGESKDAWELLSESLRRRRLFRAAALVLVLLYAVAIYAPLIANDRPYLLEAVHVEEFVRARNSLVPIALGLSGLAARTEESYARERTGGSTQSYAEALAAERAALAGRVATLERHLGEDRAIAPGALLEPADRAVELARAGRHAEASAAARELETRARELRETLDPERVSLRATRSYPLFAALSTLEVFFMALAACVLLHPAWNRVVDRVLLARDRARIRRARPWKLAGVLALSTAGALLWQVGIAGRASAGALTKHDLTSGAIRVQRVLFPPLALGPAETNLAEQYRPPTWTRAAEMTEEGAYVRGARAEREDSVTGFRATVRPVEVRAGERSLNSPWRHPLGTDALGRDLLVRGLYGARISLSVGLVSTAILMAIGVLVGSIAGYFGGRVDLLISRAIEVVICFPIFFLILVVVAFVGPSILTVMVVIGAVQWTGVARLARGEFLRLRELDFVVAARSLGLSSARIVFRHVLPNAIGPLLVAASFSVAAGILIESALSFLGFGIRLPTPSWGALINESKEVEHWWIHLFPGLMILVTVLCYNLVGDALRDATDPRSRT